MLFYASLGLNKRKLVGSARNHVMNCGQIVGVVYAMTNQIAHYHVVENLILISPADDSRLRVPVGWYMYMYL